MGGVNGALVILEQILRPVCRRVCRILGFVEDMASLRFLRRAIVFVLISNTWLFFAHGGIAFHMIRTMVTSPISAYFDSTLWDVYGSPGHTMAVILCTVLFLVLQCKRNGRSNFACSFVRQPILVQWTVLGAMIVVCVFAYCAGYETVNTEFIYFRF